MAYDGMKDPTIPDSLKKQMKCLKCDRLVPLYEMAITNPKYAECCACYYGSDPTLGDSDGDEEEGEEIEM
jgi:hypothetical protein